MEDCKGCYYLDSDKKCKLDSYSNSDLCFLLKGADIEDCEKLKERLRQIRKEAKQCKTT